MNLLRHSILIIALVLCGSSVATAQKAKPTPTTTPIPTPTPTPTPSVKMVSTYTKHQWCDQSPGKLCEAGIGDRIVVQIEHLTTAVSKNEINPTDLVVFLDGRALKGVTGVPVEDPNLNRLAFDLRRTDDSTEGWAALLGSPSLTSHLRAVTVSVGLPDKQPFPFSDDKLPPKIMLRNYHPYWLVGTFIGMLVALGLFVYLAKTKNIIRDLNPPQPPEGEKRPYSLALTQAAVWFFLVFGSFLFIYLVTGDYNTITEQALILMGIGTGTALGAAMIDATKRDTANMQLDGLELTKAKLEEEVNQLKAKVTALAGATTPEDKQALADTPVQLKETEAKLKQTNEQIAEAKSGLSKPFSESFGKDILTDVNGINLHRFQMVVWTIVLGVLFCIGVYKELAMPAFSATLLALMGISSGTYLGFKIPEKQN